MSNYRLGEQIEGTRLTPLRYVRMYRPSRNSVYLFECECGNKPEIRMDKVRSGRNKSCGCLRRARLKRGNRVFWGW